MIFGYAHVSTGDQQLDALLDAGAERVFADKISGARVGRPELTRLLDQLRPGDVINRLPGRDHHEVGRTGDLHRF